VFSGKCRSSEGFARRPWFLPPKLLLTPIHVEQLFLVCYRLSDKIKCAWMLGRVLAVQVGEESGSQAAFFPVTLALQIEV
jgi:hypothetical protein